MQYSYGVRAALATAVAFLIGAGHASAPVFPYLGASLRMPFLDLTGRLRKS